MLYVVTQAKDVRTTTETDGKDWWSDGWQYLQVFGRIYVVVSRPMILSEE
jgi:hypothetical protein